MKLHYRKYGEGPPLIILHGLFGSADNWHTLARRWGHYFTVYALDQRNHGSSPHESVMNYAEMAKDLDDFLNQEHLETVYLVGHSMGGKLAMLFSTIQPEKVQGLAVLDIGPDRVVGKHQGVLTVLRDIFPGDYDNRHELEQAFERFVPSIPVRQFLLKNVMRQADGTLAWKFNRDALLDHYEELTASLDLSDPFMGPVLFLRGANSNYFPETLPPDILYHFPLAQLLTIEDAGHWLHAEQADTVFSLINDFFHEEQ